MKSAHESFDSDLYWMMDDDGYPSKQCLEQLVVGMDNRYDYVMPTSINIDDHSQLSWPTRMKNGTKTSSYQELKDSWGKVMNFVTPFNGVLLSRKCVQEVGYINPPVLYLGGWVRSLLAVQASRNQPGNDYGRGVLPPSSKASASEDHVWFNNGTIRRSEVADGLPRS